jgi:purine-binding chemotaxis protein CheW
MNLLSFRLAHQWYALNVQHISEVLWMVYLEAMPSSPPEILGLLSMKQFSMPVLDLRKHFELPEANVTLYTPIIAAHHEGKRMAFLVDEVKEVLSIPEKHLREVDISPYVSQSFESGSELIRILNLENILNVYSVKSR